MNFGVKKIYVYLLIEFDKVYKSDNPVKDDY